jgi:hypothetical protein
MSMPVLATTPRDQSTGERVAPRDSQKVPSLYRRRAQGRENIVSVIARERADGKVLRCFPCGGGVEHQEHFSSTVTSATASVNDSNGLRSFVPAKRSKAVLIEIPENRDSRVMTKALLRRRLCSPSGGARKGVPCLVGGLGREFYQKLYEKEIYDIRERVDAVGQERLLWPNMPADISRRRAGVRGESKVDHTVRAPLAPGVVFAIGGIEKIGFGYHGSPVDVRVLRGPLEDRKFSVQQFP